MTKHVSPRLAEATRASEAVEGDVACRKDLEKEIERLNGELQQVCKLSFKYPV